MTKANGKTNRLGMTRAEMEKFCDSMGEKRFRAGQVMKWIHHFGVDDFDAMTNVSKALREKLKAVAEIRGPEVVSEDIRSEEHTSELQSLMRISYAVFCLKKKKKRILNR